MLNKSLIKNFSHYDRAIEFLKKKLKIFALYCQSHTRRYKNEMVIN